MSIVRSPPTRGLCVVVLIACAASGATAADKDTKARSPADRLLTPAQARDCIAQGDKLQADKAEALKMKADADAMRTQLEQSGIELKAQATTLDRTSASAVADYNAKVDARDKSIDALDGKAAAYNARVAELQAAQDAKDKNCATRRYDENTLNTPAKKK